LGTTVSARAVVLVPALILFLTAPALAERQEMSISQVVEYALANNGELISFREERGVHEAAKARAVVLPNPTLDFEGATGALTGSRDESSLSLGLSQEFLLSGKREKRARVAEQELEGYRWQVADRERGLRREVLNAVYDELVARQRVSLAERSCGISRQLLDVTRERVASGDIPELEMDLAKVEVARSEGAKANAANVLNQSRARLRTLMGGAEQGAPALEGTFDVGVTVAKELADLKQLALANRPDLKALDAEQRRAEAELTLARAEAVPNLTAGVVVRREATTMEIAGLEGKDTAYTVGVRLSMPIPVFDRNVAGLQEARAKQSTAATRYVSAARNVEREVESGYANYLSSDKILTLYRTSVVPQLEENLKLTQEAYRIGEVGILSVIQEQKKFYEVGEAYLAALHDRQAALVSLEAAVAAEIIGGKP
jgi:outer membrane protein, heavy metal efflux system